MSKLIRSWVESANSHETPFPLNNLPYGVFSTKDLDARCGVAIGDLILDVSTLEAKGLIKATTFPLCQEARWNSLMEAGSQVWSKFRMRLVELLIEGGETTLLCIRSY